MTDKLLHLLVSAALCILLTLITDKPKVSVALTLAVGVAKECYDYPEWELMDIVADAVGALAAAGVRGRAARVGVRQVGRG